MAGVQVITWAAARRTAHGMDPVRRAPPGAAPPPRSAPPGAARALVRGTGRRGRRRGWRRRCCGGCRTGGTRCSRARVGSSAPCGGGWRRRGCGAAPAVTGDVPGGLGTCLHGQLLAGQLMGWARCCILPGTSWPIPAPAGHLAAAGLARPKRLQARPVRGQAGPDVEGPIYMRGLSTGRDRCCMRGRQRVPSSIN